MSNKTQQDQVLHVPRLLPQQRHSEVSGIEKPMDLHMQEPDLGTVKREAAWPAQLGPESSSSSWALAFQSLLKLFAAKNDQKANDKTWAEKWPNAHR